MADGGDEVAGNVGPSGDEMSSPPFLRVSTLPVEVVSDGNCGWHFGE